MGKTMKIERIVWKLTFARNLDSVATNFDSFVGD